MPNFCGSCGHEVAEGKKFCASCGAIVEPSAVWQERQPQQPVNQYQPSQSAASFGAGPPAAGGVAEDPLAAKREQQLPQPENRFQPARPAASYGAGQPASVGTVLSALGMDDYTGEMDPEDILKNKNMGGLAYFLFFLPLVSCPESKYGRFHANQALLFLGVVVASGIVSSIFFSLLSWRLWWLSSLISLILWVLVLAIGVIGLINGFSGKAKELPIIGKIRIIN